MIKNCFSLFFAAGFLFTLTCYATETRVDSTGGLSLVLTDESQAINPFTFGNPAGLVLIDPQSRFDAAGQWFNQSSASNNTNSQIYGTLSELNNDSVKYHGFILFPTKNWAIQADGDYYHLENQTDFVFQDKSQDRARELFRTAYNFGPFIFGGQVQGAQKTTALVPGNFFGAQLVSGQGNSSALLGQGGILFSFPESPTPRQDRFLLGGIYGQELAPAQEIENLVLNINPGPTAVKLTETLTDSNVQFYGPEIYFQVPNSFETAVVTRFVNASVSNQLDSSNTGLVSSQPSYKVQYTSGTVVSGTFKANSLLFKTTYLKTGLSLVYGSGNSTYYNPDQTTSSSTTSQSWTAQGGIGWEGLLNYTLGLQAELDGVTGNTQAGGGPSQAINLFTYKVALGGEKWISKVWAFRTGIVLENDANSGAQPYALPLYTVNNGQNIVSTLITAGLGFKNINFQADFLFFFGQSSVDNSPNPNDFMTQMGIQLAASLFFN